MTDQLERFFDNGGRGVLATIKADGRPQLSTIAFCYDADRRIARVSTTDNSAKIVNLRRDPRGSLYRGSPDLASYSVAEGTVELSAVAQATDDSTVEELIDVYRQIQGEHPDWDDYREAMVRDHRLVVRLHIDRFYGLVR